MKKLTAENGSYVAKLMRIYDLGVWKFSLGNQEFRHLDTADQPTFTREEVIQRLQAAISAHISRGIDDDTWINKHIFDEDERSWPCWSLHIQEMQHAMEEVYPGCSPLSEDEITVVVDGFRDCLMNGNQNWDYDIEAVVREKIKRPGYIAVPESILQDIEEDE